MIERIVENQAVIAVVSSIIFCSMMIYKHVAIKYNLPLWKWIKNTNFSGWETGGGAP